MSDISAWSATAAQNNSASPDGFAEGQLPGSVNDCAREVMAAVRRFYQAAAFIDLGDTPTYASATTFTVPGDQTANYTAHRRIECTDASTLYGAISSSSYSDPSTTVTVSLDSGSLSASLTAVAVGLIDPAGYPIPAESLQGAASLTTGAFSGAVTSTKSCESGYTRITPNYCIKTADAASWTVSALSVGTNVLNTITAPTGAKVCEVYVDITFSASGTTDTGTIAQITAVDATNTYLYDKVIYKAVRLSAGDVYSSGHLKAPVFDGKIYINANTFSGATADYLIIGYYD